MTGEMEIRGGGVVAVDTETLRSTADAFVQLGGDLESLALRLGAVQLVLVDQGHHGADAWHDAAALRTRLSACIEKAIVVADALREAAAMYELVEINVEYRAAVWAGDADAAAIIKDRRDTLVERYPDVLWPASMAELDRTVMWPAHLVRQATELGLLAGMEIGPEGAVVGGVVLGLGTLGLATITGYGGPGRVAADARLSGRGGQAVTLVEVPPTSTSTAAPASLAAVAARMPGNGDSRVRVETYTMRDGSKQFAVYVAGTQSYGVGGDDAWDNLSNAQLYTGTSSASYEATVAALEAAGAQPGDAVHAFAHSQGGMITSHLALEEGYDVRTHVAFGSPVEAELGASTLSVAVRHTDDPAVALAGGGRFEPVGAPGSFIVEREADPETGQHDMQLPAHQMASYAETAAMIDASSDPRVGGVHAVFDELGRAESVEVVEYGALRVSDLGEISPSAGGGE
jgi:pimeloyl-ACP methyl ester carboxylesterase